MGSLDVARGGFVWQCRAGDEPQRRRGRGGEGGGGRIEDSAKQRAGWVRLADWWSRGKQCFFGRRKRWWERGLWILRAGKTVPKPCPFRTLFVPVSCPIRAVAAVAGVRSRSLATSPRLSSVVIVIAWSLYHSPPRCAEDNWRRNGFLGNAVFYGEKREKN